MSGGAPRSTRPVMRLPLPLALLLLACDGDTTAPLPREGVPDVFEVQVSGYGYGTHDVSLRGDTLVVVRREFFGPTTGTHTARVVPDSAAWRAFWAAARAAGVDDWPRECADPRIADGGGFTLRIVDGARSWQASGSNAYPRADGRCTGSATVSSDYAAFLRAVSALIGRPYP